MQSSRAAKALVVAVGASVLSAHAGLAGAADTEARTTSATTSLAAAVYQEPSGDTADLAELHVHIAPDVSHTQFRILLDNVTLGEQQLDRVLRIASGKHTLRTELGRAAVSEIVREFNFTVGPGDKYEHTVVASGVLKPATLARGCCAATPVNSAPIDVASAAALGACVIAALRRRKT
jgi:hypothetical protein